MAIAPVSPAVDWPPSIPPLPRLWVGFMLSLGFLAGEMSAGLKEDSHLLLFTRVMFSLVCLGDWLFCVHRFHVIAQRIAPRAPDGSSTYPIQPDDAVWRHFVPVYDLYWLFRWTGTMARVLRQRGVEPPSGALVGILLLVSCLAWWLEGAVAFGLMFLSLFLLASPLRAAVLGHARNEQAAKAFQ